MSAEGAPEKDTEPDQKWIPPVLPATATTGDGVAEIIEQITAHQQHLKTSGGWILREQARLKNEVGNLLHEALHKRWNSSIPPADYEKVLDQVVCRKISPRRAVEKLIKGAGL